MSSLGPITRIGKQITETILLHQKISKAEASETAIELLDKVGIPKPSRTLRRPIRSSSPAACANAP